jgi:hypothetical protein
VAPGFPGLVRVAGVGARRAARAARPALPGTGSTLAAPRAACGGTTVATGREMDGVARVRLLDVVADLDAKGLGGLALF